jgi:hypothetical protein
MEHVWRKEHGENTTTKKYYKFFRCVCVPFVGVIQLSTSSCHEENGPQYHWTWRNTMDKGKPSVKTTTQPCTSQKISKQID